ncbi:hypothetical protein [Polaromonas sp.]|uniref:hypothetical protein n=1 Tax=Polaromonas sp. TaxID=1869339 RepID=UPI0013BC56D5|nr:hypothetical protein [Polaromonas sp.]NDP63069.1 hypothetical protein [Polaromonas sp.]
MIKVSSGNAKMHCDIQNMKNNRKNKPFQASRCACAVSISATTSSPSLRRRSQYFSKYEGTAHFLVTASSAKIGLWKSIYNL